jgi:hypothetical protein
MWIATDSLISLQDLERIPYAGVNMGDRAAHERSAITSHPGAMHPVKRLRATLLNARIRVCHSEPVPNG